MDNFIYPGEHEPIFVVFGTGFKEHISKKCPINGQNLTKYVRYFIQVLLCILRQRVILRVVRFLLLL